MASYKVTVVGIRQKIGDIATFVWSSAIASAKNMPKQVISKGVGGLRARGMGSSASGSRPMKFPYTFSAKFAQFPFRFYMKHNPFCKYYPLAFVMCLPIFAYISNLSNSPNNKKVWKEIRRKEREAHHDDH